MRSKNILNKIRAIAAIDNKRGLADDSGIPWNLSMDMQHFRKKTEGSIIVMGYNTYSEFENPLPNRQNLVVCRPGTKLREGFYAVYDVGKFIQEVDQSIWIIGGAGLFKKTIHLIDELHLTQIDFDFRCTKIFPEYHVLFKRKSRGPEHSQNNLNFKYETWERLRLNNPFARKV